MYEGDLLIKNTADGGEIIVKAGNPEMDDGLENAVYLSLSGKTWWGEEYEIKTSNFLQQFILANPLTSGNLRTIEGLAKKDLAWMIVEKVCDEIQVFARSKHKNTIEILVQIFVKKKKLSEHKFLTNWQNEAAKWH